MSHPSEHTPKRIDLKTEIAALRSELIEPIDAAYNEPLRFEVGKIKMEFQVDVEQSTDAKCGLKFWVVEGTLGGTSKEKNTHKITVSLTPQDENGQKVLTGGNEAWE